MLALVHVQRDERRERYQDILRLLKEISDLQRDPSGTRETHVELVMCCYHLNQLAKEKIMQKLLFVLSKGFEKAGGATRAMQFAAIAAEQGHHVEVFLIDDAIHWAQVGMAEGIRSTTGEHLKDMLDKLVAHKMPHSRLQGLRGQAAHFTG